MLSEHRQDIPIREIFSDERFQGFVYDFYHTLPEANDPPEASEILKNIFSDKALFHRFLQYCRDHKCAFTHGETDSDALTISLHLFDCLREIYTEHIDFILNATQGRAFAKMRTSFLDGKPQDAWAALKTSIDNGIPINDRGEVLYTLEEIPGGYRVFSYQSKTHEVNEKGEVWREHLENKSDRVKISSRIAKYKRFLEVFEKEDLQDDYDRKMIAQIVKDFEAHLERSEESIANQKLYTIRLRFHVLWHITDLESIYARLQDEDVRLSKDTFTVIENNTESGND